MSSYQSARVLQESGQQRQCHLVAPVARRYTGIAHHTLTSKSSVRRAGYQDALAAPTHGCTVRRIVLVDLLISQTFAHEKVTASVGMNEHRIFADEAESGLLGVAAF